MICLIAALDSARGIGRGNAMAWHLPDDLKRFKALTLGKAILMGGNTARSLGRPLPGRRNLVLTRASHAPFAGMQAVSSLQQAQSLSAGEELMVIGGGEVYSMVLEHASRMYLTHVDTVVVDADVHFPAFDLREWKVDQREAHAVDACHALAFEFVDYSRTRNESG